MERITFGPGPSEEQLKQEEERKDARRQYVLVDQWAEKIIEEYSEEAILRAAEIVRGD